MSWLRHGTVTQVNVIALFSRYKSTMSTMSGEVDVTNSSNKSIHSDSIDEVYKVPMHVIIRPIPPVLDEQKVQSLINTIKVTRVLCE